MDRREFFNKLVLTPLIEIGVALKNPTSDSQGETLKRARTLMTIVLTWVGKTVILRNSHVFTQNIMDSEQLVTMIQTFSQFEVEQYLSLFERYSRSPKTLKLNLELYSMICRLLNTLVNCMTHFFELPRDEITNSKVFSLTIPSFLQVMTEQLNIFILTRSVEMHQFTNQLVLIHDFLSFMGTMMEYSEDVCLKELFHSFSTGFLPQTVFFLAQNVSLYEQSRSEQLVEQFHMWDSIQ